MKILFKVLLYGVVGILILVGILAAYFFIPRPSSTDSYFIPNSDFAISDFDNMAPYPKKPPSVDDEDGFVEERPIYFVQLHHLKAGKGVTFAVRTFHDPAPLYWDDEKFAKLTIHLPELVAGSFEIQKNGSVRAFYTKGGSAWPESNCGRQLDAGRIEILQMGGSTVRALVDVEFDCFLRNGFGRGKIRIKDEFIFNKILMSDVTPWIGSPSEFIYRETYR